MTAIISDPNSAAPLAVLGETIHPLLTNDMGADVEIYDTSGDTGMGPPPHHHAWSETYVMIEGELDLTVGDQPTQRLRAGMVAQAPAGASHGYRIQADGTRFLTILSTGNGHAFFQQMDAEVAFPPNLEDVVRVAANHGILFV